MNDVERIKHLTNTLNEHRNNYYNKQNPTISDYEYDTMFDELKELEDSTGIRMSNSPTMTVGYEVKSELKKVTHNHPMLSLNKTKSVDDLIAFFGDKIGFLMHKLDGLTISLRYLNGELVSAETRGNGEIGEDVLHNAKVFSNIPLHINYTGEVIVDGEAIIDYQTFNDINNALPENEKYKNPRNLASGSVRQLDSNIAAKRNIKFIAWKLIAGYNSNSFIERIEWLNSLGFETVEYIVARPISNCINNMIEGLKNLAHIKGYPIDGLVASYDDIEWSESLGATKHHVRSQIAYKFYDEAVETTLKDVQWTMGKTGVLTPTAIFESVEIDGTEIERASLHNVSIFEDFDLHVGNTVSVYKANAVVPQLAENLDSHTKNQSPLTKLITPTKCPICGAETEIRQDGIAKVLYCTNYYCKGKLISKFSHFVSKNAMNIDGMSEATIKFLIDKGWITSFIDLYKLRLRGWVAQWAKEDGFGIRSVEKILQAIDNSKNTTLDRFLYALCIPLIGRTASKTISNYFNGDFDSFYNQCCLNTFDFESLNDFGVQMSQSMRAFLNMYSTEIKELASLMTFKKQQVNNNSNSKVTDKTFVITGSLNTFKNRDEAKERIESLGGKVAGSVSSKTDYLVNNDVNSASSKNKKAKELKIPIITESEFIELLK